MVEADQVRLFDSHCHIDFSHFSEDRAEVFARMAEAGVEGAVVVSVELEQAPALGEFVDARDNLWFSVGIHPNHETNREPDVETLCRLADHPRCVAIGETGMDLFRHRVDPTIQQQRFRTHIRAARAVGKPVIVHNREADAGCMQTLAEEGVDACGGVMHCFSSDWQTASAAIDLGMMISFSGNLTFKRNDALREVAARVPLERLMIETDSPYLAPVPNRGKRNEPAFVRHVAECLSDIRDISLSDIAIVTTENSRRFFSI